MVIRIGPRVGVGLGVGAGVAEGPGVAVGVGALAATGPGRAPLPTTGRYTVVGPRGVGEGATVGSVIGLFVAEGDGIEVSELLGAADT